MLLPQTAEYALRAMCWLALQPPGTAVTGKELAEATHIPSHYLSKILRRMVVAELLDSQRGRGGGFSLSRAPDKISFCEVLDAVDAAPESGRCAFGWGKCSAADPCPMHDSWSELLDRYREWALTKSLADARDADRR